MAHHHCQGRSTCYSDRLHNFSVTIPKCYKDVYVNSFFPRTARLWNSLPIEYFPLTYDLSGFNSRINRHLLTVGSFFLCRFFLKKLHRKKQSPNFLRGSFSNADNARAPIQFRGEDQPQHLKKMIFLQEQTHSFSH